MNALIRTAGAICLIFTAFHIWLGIAIARMPLPASPLALMKMLNTGGTIFILFLGVTLTFMASEVRKSRLGSMILLLGAATFIVRAVEEIVVSPHTNIVILAVCALTGLLHAGLFMVLRCPCHMKDAELPEQSM